MARFQLTSSHNFNGKTQKAGTIICDGTACSGGDVIVVGFNAAAISNAMVALDAAAITLKNGTRFANTTKPYPTGVDSIDG